MFCFPFIRNNEYYFTVGGAGPIAGSTDPNTATTIKLVAAPAAAAAGQYQNHNLVAVTPGGTVHINNININGFNGNVSTISPAQAHAQGSQEPNHLAYSLSLHNGQVGTNIKEEPQDGTNPSVSSQQPAAAMLNFDQFYTVNQVQNSAGITSHLLNAPTIILPTGNGNTHFVIAHPSNIITKPPEQQQLTSQSTDPNQNKRDFDKSGVGVVNNSLSPPAAPAPTPNSIVVASTSNGNSVPVSIPAQLLTTKGDQVVCLKCSKIFANKYTLKTHQRTHLGIKDYKCDICDKCFSQKINLTYHMKTHSGEKGFLCPICSKSFTQLGNCRAHCAKKHGVEIAKKRRGKTKEEIAAESAAAAESMKAQQDQLNAGNTTATTDNANANVSINVPHTQYSTVNLASLMDMNIKYETF